MTNSESSVLATIILGVSTTMFLQNYFSQRQSIFHVPLTSQVIILLEILLVYFVGCVMILKSDVNLDTIAGKINLLLLAWMSMLLLLFGACGTSFRHVNFLAYALFVTAFIHNITNGKTSHLWRNKFTRCFFITLPCLFFVFSPFVFNLSEECSVLYSVSDPQIVGENAIDIYTTIYHANNEVKVSIEMILPEGDFRENEESVKKINLLQGRDESEIYWPIIFSSRSNTHIVYLFISGDSCKSQYRIEMYEDECGWHSRFDHMKTLEYFRAFYCSKLRLFYKLLIK
jgi:hypothetical protein